MLIFAHTPQYIAMQTVRNQNDGLSIAPYHQFNVALHVGDEPQTVMNNRIQLFKQLQNLTESKLKRLSYLNQTHSTIVLDVDTHLSFFEQSQQFEPINQTDVPTEADALLSNQVGEGLVIMTADCLPIVLAMPHIGLYANIHAGWKGLLNGVIENTVSALKIKANRLNLTFDPSQITAHFGVAIAQPAFEVGQEVKDLFVQKHPQTACHFQAIAHQKYLADIYGLARFRLGLLGVTETTGGDLCSFADSEQFYSYRRDNITGRMATVVIRLQ